MPVAPPIIAGRRYFLPAALLILLAFLVLASWHTANQQISGHDSGQHFFKAMAYRLALQDSPSTVLELLRLRQARYLPLTYLLTAGAAELAGDGFRGAIVTTLIFWLILMIGAIAFGRHLSRQALPTLLVGFIVLANPVFWTVATAFNLEIAALATEVVALGLFFAADRWNSPFMQASVALFLAILAATKPIAALCIVPAALILISLGDPALRRRRLFLLVVYLTVLGAWLLPDWRRSLAELRDDVLAGRSESMPGAGHYFWLLAVGYRGLIAWIALGYLLAKRWNERDWQVEDWAFAFAGGVPLVFYFAAVTKRDWYLLGVHLVLALWLAFSFGRRPSKRLAICLGILYGGLALAEIVLVGLTPRLGRADLADWAGVSIPAPPPAADRELAALIANTARQNPAARLTMDLTRGDQRVDRIFPLLVNMNSCLVVDQQIAFGEWVTEKVSQFDRPEFVFTLGEDWPTFDTPEGSNPLEAEKYTQVRAVFQAEWPNYLFYRRERLSDGQVLTVFARREPVREPRPVLAPAVCLPMALKPWSLSWQDSMMRQARQAFERGDFHEAARLHYLVAQKNSRQCEAAQELAKSLTELASAAAPAWWEKAAETCPSFGHQMASLQSMLDYEVRGRLPAGSFLAYWERLLAANAAVAAHRYSLYLAHQEFALRRDDIPAVLADFPLLRAAADPSQIAGIDLAEADIDLRLNRLSDAERLVRRNLTAADPANPLAGSFRLMLARVQIRRGDPSAAARTLREAPRGSFDPPSFAEISLEVAQKSPPEAVAEWLTWAAAQVDGPPRGLLLIELGKDSLAGGRPREAREYFSAAGGLVRDPKLLQWVRQTIKEIETTTTANPKEGE